MIQYSVQAVYLMKSGRVHKLAPVELGGDKSLEEYERKIKYSMVQEGYLIEGRNDRNHAIVIRPLDVETAVVDIKSQMNIPDFEEPAYEELQAKWEKALQADDDTDYPDEAGMDAMEPLPDEPVVVPVEPKDPQGVVSVVSGHVAETEINSETTQTIKVPKWNVNPPSAPQQKVQWPEVVEQDSEKTQPMVVLKAEEVKAMEQEGDGSEELLKRVANGLKGDTGENPKPERPRAAPPAARRRARSGPRGKTPQPPK